MTPEQIKRRINALDFVQTELVLYLDVHPHNDAARMQWQKNASELEALELQHVKLTGEPWPMRQNHHGGMPEWVTSPWPWDNQN